MLSDLVRLYTIVRDAPGVSLADLLSHDVGHVPGGSPTMPAHYGIAPLPTLQRQYAFVFERQLAGGVRMHLNLMDRVTFEARVLGINRRNVSERMERYAPYDLLLGYGGLDVHYDKLQHLGFQYQAFSDADSSGCCASIDAFGGLDLGAPWRNAPICNVHAMFADEQPPVPGARILVDGYSAVLWFTGGPFTGAVSGSRAWRSSGCVWYVPAAIDLPALADDVLYLDASRIDQMMQQINPVMHLAEQLRLQRVPQLQLRHAQQHAGLLGAS